MTPVQKILSLWRVQSAYLAFGAALSVGAVLAGIALMANAGHYTAAAVLGVALVVPLAMQLAGAARVVLRYLERLVTHDAMFRAFTRVRVWFFIGLARSAAGGLGLRGAGDTLARLVNDVEALDGLYMRILVPGLGAFLVLPVLGFFLWRERPWALLVLPIYCLIAFLLPMRAARLAEQNAARAAAAMASLRNAALDTFSGLREVKIFAAEGRMLAAVQSREADLLSAQRDLAVRVSRLNAFGFLSAQGGLLLILLIGLGGGPIFSVAAVFVATAAFEAVSAMPRAGVLYGQAKAAAARVVEAAEAPPPVAEPAGPAAMPASHALTLDHVSFRFADNLPWVFENLSLQLPAGSRTAILGPSGAGKSTIATLILKLAAPVAGKIRLGAADIAALPTESLRQRIAYLSQSTHLFADTIRNNLRLGDPSADDARLSALCRTVSTPGSAKPAARYPAARAAASHWLGPCFPTPRS
jgi:ATP-binding cassette subfamily C protein CydC